MILENCQSRVNIYLTLTRRFQKGENPPSAGSLEQTANQAKSKDPVAGLASELTQNIAALLWLGGYFVVDSNCLKNPL